MVELEGETDPLQIAMKELKYDMLFASCVNVVLFVGCLQRVCLQCFDCEVFIFCVCQE